MLALLLCALSIGFAQATPEEEAEAAQVVEETEAAPAEEEAEATPPEEGEATPPEEGEATPPEGDGKKKPPQGEPWEKVGWGWGAIPAVNYNSDEGFGFGALGSFYRYDGETQPYKMALTLLFFMTTRNVHSHRIDFDWLDVGDTPLRLTFRVQLDATNTANFCGYGWDVECDPALAEEAADDLGLTGEDRDDFVRRYYYLRWMRPNGYAVARYRVSSGKPEVEVFAGWRGEMFMTGFWKNDGPWPDSYYAETVGEEDGFLSVLQAGANLDTRDNEPAPRRGMWHEVSIRGAWKYFGSAWDYFGFNATARFYAPLVKEGILTLASRTVFDGMVGDAHVRELAAVGGIKSYSFGGGDSAGRGIRLRRYIGRVKAMEQLELRYAFVRFRVVKANTELTLLLFGDMIVAGEDWSDIGPAFAHPHFGEGIGLRVAINQNFVIRADVGFSDVENWSPGVYIDIDNLF